MLPLLVALGVPRILAQGCIIVVTTLFSYFGHRFFSFRRKDASGAERDPLAEVFAHDHPAVRTGDGDGGRIVSPHELSIVVPVRNGMPYLPDAIGSALADLPDEAELIVRDNGSTDGTAEWLAHLRDPGSGSSPALRISRR